VKSGMVSVGKCTSLVLRSYIYACDARWSSIRIMDWKYETGLEMLAVQSLTNFIDFQTQIFLFNTLISIIMEHSVDCFSQKMIRIGFGHLAALVRKCTSLILKSYTSVKISIELAV
jgi:hypothetical protein